MWRGTVYPRVGGETKVRPLMRRCDMGLSPRGRGNPAGEGQRDVRQGSIPAWAGKPATNFWPRYTRQVYPRVGGETSRDSARLMRRCGLSPRGRGNHGTDTDCAAESGSIPAWAGKPPAGLPGITDRRVYPRVGGETGDHRRQARPRTGLSPRGRGNPAAGTFHAHGAGSIPAWAGKPTSRSPSRRRLRVYPRVGGETQPELPPRCGRQGLSPRGRGNRLPPLQIGSPPRSIPAWAGKPQRKNSSIE